MRAKDVRECVDIVATDPIIGLRYGATIVDLRSAWLKVLGLEDCRAVIFEELQGTNLRVLGSGMSVFVSNDFIAELKKPPFYLGWSRTGEASNERKLAVAFRQTNARGKSRWRT